MQSKKVIQNLMVLISPVLFFYLAVGVVILKSFSEITFELFLSLFNGNLIFSILISFLAASISLGIGSLIAFAYPVKNFFLRKIFRLTVFAPHLAFAYLIYLFFSPSGIMSRVIYPFGQETVIINDSLGVGILLHYIIKEIPFVFLFLLSSNSINERKLFKISMDLGASRFETFLRIYLPLKKDYLRILFILMFSYSLTSYEAPFLLGHYSREFTSVEIMNNFNSLSMEENSFAQIQAIFIFFINVLVALFLLGRRKR